MRLMTAWRVAALAGALLWGACTKDPAPAPAPKPAQPAAEPAEAPEPAQEAEAEAPAAEAAVEPEAPPAPRVDNGERPEFKVGMDRDEVMKLFDGCAERRLFVPPGPNTLYVEVYQAIQDEACVKRLGERHFLIRGGLLHSIEPGRMAEPPSTPPPEGF
ncbi:MAG TPA: hypothetical protein VF815_47480 [Myxococcaceae bacterium]|jgi:hypothetical protein